MGLVVRELPIWTACCSASASVRGMMKRPCFRANSGLHIGAVHPVSGTVFCILPFERFACPVTVCGHILSGRAGSLLVFLPSLVSLSWS